MIRILRASQRLIKIAAARFSQKIDNNKQKTVISEEAQRAIWAETIIKKILESSWPKSLTQLSLREEILKIQFPTDKFQWTQKVKNEVMQMFDGGVKLNLKVYTQQRVAQAIQKPLKNQLMVLPNQPVSSTQYQSNIGNFIFCPNYTVTKHIFKAIMSQWDKCTMISGGFGLSKSISIILFIQLSNMVNGFIYKALKDQEKYKRQLEQIILQGFLKLSIPKIFYWSIDPKNFGVLYNHYLLDIFLEQANELQESQKIRIRKKSSGISLDELWTYYPKQMPKKVVIDQINRLASHIRKYQNKEVKKKNDEDYLIVVKFLPFLDQCTNLMYIDGFVINSSCTIEERYLYANRSSLNLRFDQHHGLHIVNIEFQKYIEDQGAKIDFLQMLWFEIERNLKLLKCMEINIIKEQFIRVALTFKFSYFSRFLYCRQYFQASPEKLVEIIQDKRNILVVLSKLEGYTYKFFQQKLKQFLQKEKGIVRKNNLLVMAALVFHCEQIINQRFARNQQQQPPMLVLSLRELEQKYNLQIGNIVSRSQFKQIIPYDGNSQNGRIIIPYYPFKFVKYAMEILFPQFKDEFFKMDREFYMSDGALRGKLVEFYLIRALVSESNFRLPQYFSAQIFQKCQSKTIFFNKQVFSEKQAKKRLQKQGLPYKLQEYFQTVISRCKSNPNKYIMAVPDDQKSQTKNMSFDFSICIYNIEKGGRQKYKLYTFDVTVSKDPKTINKKRQKASQLFKFLLEDSQLRGKIEVKHTILCPINQNQAVKNQYVEINVFNYKRILMKTKMKLNFQKFRHMVQLCQTLSLQEQKSKQAKKQKSKQENN